MPKQTATQENILVIKLGALGDFIQAMGPMRAIRKHHKDENITLMTTKTFENFGQDCGYFDNIWIDKKPKLLDLKGWIFLRKAFLNRKFDRIYDLQNNDRTGLYFKLFPKSKRPEWVGIAKGASHENNLPERTAGHAFDGHKLTLSRAGVHDVEIDTLHWIQSDLSKFNLQKPYILLVSGSAPQHPQKRWPPQKYAALANTLIQNGYQIILIGTHAEKNATDIIHTLCPNALNLTGQTSLFEIATLAHNASATIGNDTGPIHMIAPTGCPTLVLFSGHSTPKRHAPKGKNVSILQEENLNDLETDLVMNTTKEMLKKKQS